MPTVVTFDGYFNDDLQTYIRLFRLCENVRNIDDDVEFSFRNCYFLRQNAIAILGALVCELKIKGKKVSFNLDGIGSAVKQHIEDNDFINAIQTGKSNGYKTTTVPYRIDEVLSQEEYVSYLENEWLGSRIWIDGTSKEVIIKNVIEAYINVFDHASSAIGVTTCGQHFPNRNQGELVITMVDFGVGIPANVRQYRKDPQMPPDEALSWAFQEGSTTKHSGIARGLGLKELKKFVKVNDGTLEVFSDDAYIKFAQSGDEVRRFSQFRGTIVQIKLKSDRLHYDFDADKHDDEPLF